MFRCLVIVLATVIVVPLMYKFLYWIIKKVVMEVYEEESLYGKAQQIAECRNVLNDAISQTKEKVVKDIEEINNVEKQINK